MFLDLHIHTNRYSACSRLAPEKMLEVAAMLKLDGIVVVEHGVLWTPQEIEELKHFPHADELIILRGQEIRTYNKHNQLGGDILVFGVEESIEDMLTAPELVKRVHDEGGVAVAAHPYRWGVGLEDLIFELDLDGLEILNGNCTPDEMFQAKKAQEKLQLASTGGSDSHKAEAIGNYLTWFDDKITTEAELAAAIKAKRCRPAHYEEVLIKYSPTS